MAYTLGATLAADGVAFALYSRTATAVDLVLFDRPAGPPTRTVPLEGPTAHTFATVVPGIGAGQLYGYRVHGRFDPSRGFRCNEHKLLIDPYAKALTGKAVNQDGLLLGYDPGAQGRDLSQDTRDNAHIVPKAIVVDDAFDWQGDRPPTHPLHQTIIYEVHLKGFTAHSSSRVQHPGTYLGFIEKIPHLQRLGVTAVELLPVQEFQVEDGLRQRGLTNYWGYNTIGFFAPESSYAAGSAPGCQVTEFKTLVRELHRAGIEVILDVVFNHTGEGSELGPTLSFRGIDNPTYYSLVGPEDHPGRYYRNVTGCGNTVNIAETAVVRLVMDSLRYWTEVMHVDGFRFDLAAVLGREGEGFDPSAALFDAIAQDPVLQRVKLIAEPWDVQGDLGGRFPVDWSEWNGRFRDTVRRFTKGDAGQLGELGSRLTGSADLYGDDGRAAYNSVNFVTCHDGFTLWDLVSYSAKHNEANGEDNRDGTNDNHSWNWGAEGETGDPGVVALRKQLIKNCACMLLFSAGTTMLLGGDEFARTQRGNNNAYCQDNALSWFDWDYAGRQADLTEFFRKAIALTSRYPILQRRRFFTGAPRPGDPCVDLTWFGADGAPPAWQDPEERLVALLLDGAAEPSTAGRYLLFLIFNAGWTVRRVLLPQHLPSLPWRRIVDTSLAAPADFMAAGTEVDLNPTDAYLVNPRSTVLLISEP